MKTLIAAAAAAAVLAFAGAASAEMVNLNIKALDRVSGAIVLDDGHTYMSTPEFGAANFFNQLYPGDFVVVEFTTQGDTLKVSKVYLDPTTMCLVE